MRSASWKELETELNSLRSELDLPKTTIWRSLVEVTRRLERFGIPVPRAEEIEVVDLVDRPFDMLFGIDAVLAIFLPRAQALLAEESRRAEAYSGNEVTPEMLQDLLRRFPPKH